MFGCLHSITFTLFAYLKVLPKSHIRMLFELHWLLLQSHKDVIITFRTVKNLEFQVNLGIDSPGITGPARTFVRLWIK